MVVTPAQFRQFWQSIKGILPYQTQAKNAQLIGYTELPPTPRLGAMQETEKGANTELTQPQPAEQQEKPGFEAQEPQILKPSVLPATTMHSPHTSSNSSSLGSLAPQAPPPINIHAPQPTAVATIMTTSDSQTIDAGTGVTGTRQRASVKSSVLDNLPGSDGANPNLPPARAKAGLRQDIQPPLWNTSFSTIIYTIALGAVVASLFVAFRMTEWKSQQGGVLNMLMGRNPAAPAPAAADMGTE